MTYGRTIGWRERERVDLGDGVHVVGVVVVAAVAPRPVSLSQVFPLPQINSCGEYFFVGKVVVMREGIIVHRHLKPH